MRNGGFHCRNATVIEYCSFITKTYSVRLTNLKLGCNVKNGGVGVIRSFEYTTPSPFDFANNSEDLILKKGKVAIPKSFEFTWEMSNTGSVSIHDENKKFSVAKSDDNVILIYESRNYITHFLRT